MTLRTLGTNVAALNNAYARQMTCDGSTTLAQLNAFLADTSVAGTKRLAGSITVNGPIVVPGGTTLDARGFTAHLASASNTNLLINSAVNTVRRVLDAVTTSGSATLTSATAAFVSGDVGKPITIQGAGASGVPLTTTISAVTNGTTVTLATTAGTSVSGQYAAIGARDADITIIGGAWDHGTNYNGGRYTDHVLRFRHVDRVSVFSPKFPNASGKYALNFGDCTSIYAENPGFSALGSDGVHLNGPIQGASIVGVEGGSLNDDVVSLTARDSTSLITDTAGDITDVDVYGSKEIAPPNPSAGTFTSALKLVAGQTTDGSANYAVKRVRAYNLSAPTTTAPVVYIGDTSGGTFDDIDLHGVTSLGPQGGAAREAVLIHGGAVGRVGIHGVYPAVGDKSAVTVDTAVDRLDITEAHAWSRISGALILVTAATGVVKHLRVNGASMKGTTTSQGIVQLASSGTVNFLRITNAQFEASAAADGSATVSAPSGTTLGVLDIDQYRTVNVDYPLGVLAQATTVLTGAVHATGMTYWLWSRSGAAVVLVPSPRMIGDNDRVKEDVTGSVITRRQTIFTRPMSAVAAGETTLPREVAQVTEQQLTSGRLYLTYFTADRTQALTNATTKTRSTAAAGTTLARVGLYTVAANGDLTLVNSITSDTAMWGSTFASYNKALGSMSLVAGQRYAFGVLWVGTTGPKLVGINPQDSNLSPRMNGNVDSQADLPSTVATASVLSTAGTSLYALIN